MKQLRPDWARANKRDKIRLRGHSPAHDPSDAVDDWLADPPRERWQDRLMRRLRQLGLK